MDDPYSIRHVRYEDFLRLASDGVHDLASLTGALDALVAASGDLRFHHVLVDLREATAPPIPGLLLVQAIAEMDRRGIGVKNKVAFVYDPSDLARAGRLPLGEAIAGNMGVGLRVFDDYARALDWLSAPG